MKKSFGEMGKPFIFTYEDREIKLCCKVVRRISRKDPAKYIKKIEEAEAKPKSSLPAGPIRKGRGQLVPGRADLESSPARRVVPAPFRNLS